MDPLDHAVVRQAHHERDYLILPYLLPLSD